jgi:hypothetical protein
MKLSDGEEYYSLWRFLGPQWLNGSHLNDMLELLRLKINTTGINQLRHSHSQTR